MNALLVELESAAEARDADRFAQSLSEGFRGEGGLVRTEAVAQLKRYFAAYETIAVDVAGVEIERAARRASLRCVVELTGRPKRIAGLGALLPPSAAYRFELEVAEEAGVWRVLGAGWQPVAPRAEPGAEVR